MSNTSSPRLDQFSRAAGQAQDFIKSLIGDRDPFAWNPPARDATDPDFIDGQLVGVDLQNQDVISPSCSPTASPVMRASQPPQPLATPTSRSASRPASPYKSTVSPRVSSPRATPSNVSPRASASNISPRASPSNTSPRASSSSERPVSPTSGRPISSSTRGRNIGTADSQARRSPSCAEGTRQSSRYQRIAARRKEAEEKAAQQAAEEAERKKKKKLPPRPSILVVVRPLNVPEEQEKFMKAVAAGERYDPQFTYQRKADVVKDNWTKYSNVHTEFFDIAVSVLKKVTRQFPNMQDYFDTLYGTEKTPNEDLVAALKLYLRELGVEDKVVIKLCNSMAVASVTKPDWHAPHIVQLTTGSVARGMVQGILDHEIGTHLLRMMNDEHQLWYQKRKKHDMKDHVATEEGLASIHSLFQSPLLYLWSPAIRYYAACKGTDMGFYDLWKDLEQFVQDPNKRFNIVCRCKRGLSDTSEKGSFRVDQAYFKGAVTILRNVDHIDWWLLYCGQIAIEDMKKVKNSARKNIIRLPTFLDCPQKVKKYKQFLYKVAEANDIVVSKTPTLDLPPVNMTSIGFKQYGRKEDGVKIIDGQHFKCSDKSRTSETPFVFDALSALEASRKVTPEAPKVLSQERLNALSAPLQRSKSKEKEVDEDVPVSPPKKIDMAKILELAKPKVSLMDESRLSTSAGSNGSTGKKKSKKKKVVTKKSRAMSVPAQSRAADGSHELKVEGSSSFDLDEDEEMLDDADSSEHQDVERIVIENVANDSVNDNQNNIINEESTVKPESICKPETCKSETPSPEVKLSSTGTNFNVSGGYAARHSNVTMSYMQPTVASNSIFGDPDRHKLGSPPKIEMPMGKCRAKPEAPAAARNHTKRDSGYAYPVKKSSFDANSNNISPAAKTKAAPGKVLTVTTFDFGESGLASPNATTGYNANNNRDAKNQLNGKPGKPTLLDMFNKTGTQKK